MAATAHSLQIRSIAHLPTISIGQCCDLKIETDSGERWWLCRLPVGQTDHRITVERYTAGRWETTQVFADKETK
jgi:hypothetical protein